MSENNEKKGINIEGDVIGGNINIGGTVKNYVSVTIQPALPSAKEQTISDEIQKYLYEPEGLDAEIKDTEFYIPLIPTATRLIMKPQYQVLKKIDATPGYSEISEPVSDIREAILKLRRFVLLGEPGGGKTTTLHELARQARENYVTNGHLPFIVRLSDWPQDQDIWVFLQNKWLAKNLVGSIEKTPHLLLLLDGLNEMPSQTNARIDNLRELLHPSDKTRLKRTADWQIIISCRRDDYSSNLDMRVSRVMIERLSNEQVEEYLRKCDVIGLIKKLLPDYETGSTPEHFYHLIRNPQSLALIVDLYQKWHNKGFSGRDVNRVLHNRGQLFREYVNSRWDIEPHPEVRAIQVPLEVMEFTLSEFALKMINENEGTSVNAEVADQVGAYFKQGMSGIYEERELRALQNEFHKYGIDQQKKHLIYRLAQSAGLLDISPDGFSSIQFKHQRLQEYFAAIALQRRWQKDNTRLDQLANLSDSYVRNGSRQTRKWDEVFVMLAGFVDSDQFVMHILETAPFLTAEICGSGAVQVREDTLNKVIDQHLKILIRDIQDHKTISSIDALGKTVTKRRLSEVVPAIVEVWSKRTESDRALYQTGHYAFQRISDKFRLSEQTLLQYFPTSDPQYPNEKIVWAWMKHGYNDYIFDNEYIKMQSFKNRDETIREELWEDNRLTFPKKVLVSDIHGAIEIFRECLTNNLPLYLIDAMDYKEVVSFILDSYNSDIAPHFVRHYPETTGTVFLRNSHLSWEHIYRFLQHPKARADIIDGLSFFLGEHKTDRLPNGLADILQNHEYDLVEIILELTIANIFTNSYPVAGAIEVMAGVSPEIGVPALANLFVAYVKNYYEKRDLLRVDNAPYDLQRIAARIRDILESKQGYVSLSIITLDSLVEIADTPINDEHQSTERFFWGWAAEILGFLKQRHAIPALIKNAYTSYWHPMALAYLGLGNNPAENDSIVEALRKAYSAFDNYSAVRALGILKANQALDDLLTAFQSRVSAKPKTGVLWSDSLYAEALGEMGIVNERVVQSITQALVLEIDYDDEKHWYELFKFKRVVAVSLFKLIGTQAVDSLVQALTQIMHPKLKHKYASSHLSSLSTTLVNLILETGIRSEGTVRCCVRFFDFSRTLEGVHGVDKEWYELPTKLMRFFASSHSQVAIRSLKDVLYEKNGSADWENAIEALGHIGTQKAIEAICVVYFNRRGDDNPDGPYYDAHHDKLCGLATRAIAHNGTLDTFCILMRELDQYAIQKKITIWTIQIGNDATYWIPDMERELRAIADPEIAANYIRAWLITDMTANLRVFLGNALSWNSQLIGVLDRTIEETDDTEPGLEYADEFLKKLKQEFTKPEIHIDIENRLPSLSEIIQEFDNQ